MNVCEFMNVSPFNPSCSHEHLHLTSEQESEEARHRFQQLKELELDNVVDTKQTKKPTVVDTKQTKKSNVDDAKKAMEPKEDVVDQAGSVFSGIFGNRWEDQFGNGK